MALPEIEVRIGADTREAEAGLNRVQGEMRETGQAAQSASRSTARMNATMRNAGKSSASMKMGVQNASFQVADFAVQVGAGTSATRAMAMQLPQLLGGFGVLGAVAGGVVAVLGALVSSLGDAEEKTTDFADAIKTLSEARRSLEQRLFAMQQGIASTELATAQFQRQLIIQERAALVADALNAKGRERVKINRQIEELNDKIIQLGLEETRIQNILNQLRDEELRKIAAGLRHYVPLTQAQRELARSVDDTRVFMQGVIENATKLRTELGDAAFEALRLSGVDMASGVDAAAKSAAVLAANLGIAYAQAVALQNVGRDPESGKVYSGRGTAVPSQIDQIMAGLGGEFIEFPEVGGGGGGSIAENMDAVTESIKEALKRREEAWIEHYTRIAMLTQGSTVDQIGAWGSYFSDLITLTGTNNEKLLKMGKAFAAAQALIDAWGAHNKVLNDPTLPWWARIASALQVLGAGLGAVNAIRSVSSSGRGGAGSTSASSAAAAPSPLEARVTGIDPNSLFTGASITSLFDALQDEAGDRGLRVTFAS